MKNRSGSIARSVVCATLVFCVAAAHSAEVTIHWFGGIAQTDIRFEGQFSFFTDDPDATSVIDLLAVGTNTDVVISDGVTSQTWSYVVPDFPSDVLNFRYCPGGEAQCAIPAAGSFVAAALPTWTGVPLQTDCGVSIPVPCAVTSVQFRGEDPPVAIVFTDVSLATAGFAFEVVPTQTNEAPVADAGIDQSVRVGDTVTLLGVAFDDNTAEEDLLYMWSFIALPDGSNSVLINFDTPTPSFDVDVAGQYEITLVVTDSEGLASTPDMVTISSANLAPTADAGADQIVLVGSTVGLDGSGSSDPENDPLTYSWMLSGPPGSSAPLVNPNSESPSFVPDVAGVFVATLNVSDLIGPGTPDTVEVTASTAEQLAEESILAASGAVAALGTEDVTTQGNRVALLNFLAQALAAIQEGDLLEAIDKLQKALNRTDGCVLRGIPDGNGPGRDWITNCDDQNTVYALLHSALSALIQ